MIDCAVRGNTPSIGPGAVRLHNKSTGAHAAHGATQVRYLVKTQTQGPTQAYIGKRGILRRTTLQDIDSPGLFSLFFFFA